MLAVVPSKECLTVASGIFDAAKALGEVGSVFHGLELRLRIGVVVGDVGAAVALCHVQVTLVVCKRCATGSQGTPSTYSDRDTRPANPLQEATPPTQCCRPNRAQ